MTLTKEDLTRVLMAHDRFPLRDCKAIVECIFEEITLSLEQGDEVKLSNFGVFSLLTKKARPGRNPKSGIEVEISARRVVSFHASRKLSDCVATPSMPTGAPKAKELVPLSK